MPSIARHLRDRPAAWIDDTVTAEARAWAADRAVPTLLLEVDPEVGLTRDTVDLALQWAAQQIDTDFEPPE